MDNERFHRIFQLLEAAADEQKKHNADTAEMKDLLTQDRRQRDAEIAAINIALAAKADTTYNADMAEMKDLLSKDRRQRDAEIAAINIALAAKADTTYVDA
eukprot:gene31504-18784_t